MVYTYFKDGYARESPTAYGISTIVDTNSTTYLFGVIGQTAVHPSPRTTVSYRAPGVGAQESPDGEVWKESFDLVGMYPTGMQNAVLIQAVMGGSTTTDDDPEAGYYTHAIAPPAPVAGVLPELPSFSIYHERSGTSTDWSIVFTGVKVAGLLLTCSFDQKYLIGRVDWIARKAEKVGFVLTDDPILPPTKSVRPFHFTNMSLKFDSVEVGGLRAMEMSISPEFDTERAPTWDSGEWTGQYLRSLIESPRKKYQLMLTYEPTASTLWDELLLADNTKSIVIRWNRDSTYDYIEATLLDCQIISHDIVTPELGVTLQEQIIIEPRAVSFEVVDQIPKTHYGEA